MNEINYKSNQILNTSISFAEIKNIAFRLKNKKAAGIDLVPNEILKCDNILFFYRT